MSGFLFLKFGVLWHRLVCLANFYPNAHWVFRILDPAPYSWTFPTNSPDLFVAKSSSVFDSLRQDIDALAAQLGVSSILVMRSLPQHMQVEASGGRHEDTYPIGAQGKKSSLAHNSQALYCERVVDTDQPLYVKDSRLESDWAGNEDEVEFGLSNYLGYPVRGPDGEVYGTVCALHEDAKEYSAEERAALDEFRKKVEAQLARDLK